MNRTVLYKWNISSLLSFKTFVNFLPPDLHSLTSNYIYPLFSSLSFYLPFQEFAFTRMWTKGENPQGRTRSRRRRVKQHPTSPSLLLRVYARRGYFPSECIERQMFSFSCSSMGDDCSARRKFGDSPKVAREIQFARVSRLPARFIVRFWMNSEWNERDRVARRVPPRINVTRQPRFLASPQHCVYYFLSVKTYF